MSSNKENSIVLPVLPLENMVLFPNVLMPLTVGRFSSIAAISAAMASEDKQLLVFTQTNTEVEDPKREDLFEIGTLAVIKKMDRNAGNLYVFIEGVQRVQLEKVSETGPFLNAVARLLPEPKDNGTDVEALHREILGIAGKVSRLLQPHEELRFIQAIEKMDDPVDTAYSLASWFGLEMGKSLSLLSANSRTGVLRIAHEFLNHELQVLQLQRKIASQAQSEISTDQRKYMLRQQLRAIQEELGEKDSEQTEVADLHQRFKETNLPENIRKDMLKELTRLERMPSAASDYQVTRSYLEFVIELPWNESTEDVMDLRLSREVLDEDHYNLDEVKDRIIEHLAVMKLNPDAKAPILCFVGPPGVGKTSLGQSIARSLGRRFERLSLGGLHDESELRGHRRTYVGAMPGRIVQALHRAGVNNPLLMLDEVDKIGRDFRGDPAAALMEILDPSQNKEFYDNYLNLPFDLSKIFFIATANTLDTIPKPLLDRMEILRLHGYSDGEKKEIAIRYLLTRQIKEAGLKEGQLIVPDQTLNQVVRRYTREAGVRELERMLGRIARKVAIRFVEGHTDPVTVTPDDLADILGPERFSSESIRRNSSPGVATGLAWTEVGGEVMHIESVQLPKSGGLTLTGQLGDVMQESARAAQSYIWSHADLLGINPEQIAKSGIHIHVPAGATPKDGPSAGVTIATALVSLYSGLPVRNDTAMTGEITLSGLVLPIGGLKEKVLAAHRMGIRRIIIPKENERDLRELPDHVRAQMEFFPVECIENVFKAAIKGLADRFSKGQSLSQCAA